MLAGDVGGDQEAEQQDQRRRDEQLGAERELVVVVHVGFGGAARRAAGLDHGAAAMCADQVLTAHLMPLPVSTHGRYCRDLEP